MKHKLKELVDIKYGKNQKKVVDPSGEYPILGTGGIMGSANDYIYDKPSVLIGRKGSIGKVKYIDKPFWTVDTLFYTIVNEEKVIPRYLYYRLSLIDFNHYNEGTTIPSLRTTTLNDIELEIQPIRTQKRVTDILTKIEGKIELNNKMNKTLEEIAMLLYKHWFVDFGPFQGGEFIESEVGEIPKGWKVVTLSDVCRLLDSRRIPLSKMERQKRKGAYRYYGATSIMDYVNDYIFDGTYVLIGEDGSVIKDDNTPYVQYVSGKFWVNNHAHVLEGKNGVSTEWLNVFLRNLNVSPIVTGAVQLKINQKNLKRVKFLLPEERASSEFNEKIRMLHEQILANNKENKFLKEIRDYLLPKLLSGEIDLSDAEQRVEEVTQ